MILLAPWLITLTLLRKQTLHFLLHHLLNRLRQLTFAQRLRRIPFIRCLIQMKPHLLFRGVSHGFGVVKVFGRVGHVVHVWVLLVYGVDALVGLSGGAQLWG
jgi:hypothetical protein